MLQREAETFYFTPAISVYNAIKEYFHLQTFVTGAWKSSAIQIPFGDTENSVQCLREKMVPYNTVKQITNYFLKLNIFWLFGTV